MLLTETLAGTEALQSKWKPLLEHSNVPAIKDTYKRAVTSILLENEEKFLKEDAPVNNMGDGAIGTFDPILIALVRRAMPLLIAYDVCGLQPMTGPTGLIFAMKSKYSTQAGTEALFDEANSAFTGMSAEGTFGGQYSNDPQGANFAGVADSDFDYGTGMTTMGAEHLGDTSNTFQEMAFSIDKVTVTAKSRALKAEYTTELAQDLKAIHGLDAEAELANILSTEILSEINREVIRVIYFNARRGCASGTATQYVFNLDTDANGRWSVEKFKGLLYQIEREANFIARTTRRGKGNMLICSADVASALSMAGVLEYNPQMSTQLNVDEATSTFAGILNGRFRVYVDPYYVSSNGYEYAVVGYKGSIPYDAGLFYCPYVPLQMVRAVDPNSFQPKIGFKTRYGIAVNPFISNSNTISANANHYYRRFAITNLL